MKSTFILIVGLLLGANSVLAQEPSKPDACGAFLAQDTQYKNCRFAKPVGEPDHDLLLNLAHTVKWPGRDDQYTSTWELNGGNIRKVSFIFGRNPAPGEIFISELLCTEDALVATNVNRPTGSVWISEITNLPNGKARIQLSSKQHTFAVDATCNR